MCSDIAYTAYLGLVHSLTHLRGNFLDPGLTVTRPRFLLLV